MLAALTCAEDEFDRDGRDDGRDSTGLVLSGPALCMTSAETCRCKIDLRSEFVDALCSLTVSIPYHETYDGAASNGRLVLTRAEVSVRFHPGGEGGDDVQYAVRSVTPYHAPDSVLLRNAAATLARDMDDPLFHHDEHRDDDGVYAAAADGDGAVDARDRFLLSRRLADSGLLSIVASDQIDGMHGAARAKTTGFRSALHQLDGVTNVSSKLQGLGRFSLSALLTAKEMEAAEREAEAASAVRYPRRPPPSVRNVKSSQPRFPPPPPPPPQQFPLPPMAQQAETSSSVRPRPLIGDLLMSGLLRLAAASTNPDEQKAVAGRSSSWGEDECGRTTWSIAPPAAGSLYDGADGRAHLALHRREKDESHDNGEPRGYTDLTPLAAHQPQRQHANNSVRRMTGLYRRMPGGWMARSMLMMVAMTADREKSVALQRPSSRLQRRVLLVHQPRRCTKNDAFHSSKKNMLMMKPLSILVINLLSLDRQL